MNRTIRPLARRVILIAGVVTWQAVRQIWLAQGLLPEALAEFARAAAARMLLYTLALVAVIAAADIMWKRFDHRRKQRMSMKEVRDEHKESDGRPEVKAKLREMQQAAANNRMMEKVPTADVIITNPTHFAVALKYDEARMAAPMLLAKGADNIAAKIRELAAEHDVPIVESPRLARAVFASTDLDAEIPGGLYLAVAQILTYVYQLRSWETMGGDYPEAPEPEVADEYLGNLL